MAISISYELQQAIPYLLYILSFLKNHCARTRLKTSAKDISKPSNI
jgi:hypothetical protein